MQVLWIVLGINAAVWTVLYLVWRIMRGRMEEKLNQDVSFAGEYFLLGPQTGMYFKRVGIAKISSIGVMALTNKRFIFRMVFGRGVEILYEDIAGLSAAKWFHGTYRNGQPFMILTLRDDSEIGFQTRDQETWAEQIQGHMSR